MKQLLKHNILNKIIFNKICNKELLIDNINSFIFLQYIKMDLGKS